MKRISINLQIWLLAFILIAGVIGYGFYTTFSVNRQIRQNFYRQAEQAVQSISDEIAAPLWLYQQPYVNKTFRAFQNTSSIAFIRLLNKDGELSHGAGDAAYAAIIEAFAAGGIAHVKKDGIYLVRHPVIYKNEIQGTLFVGFTMREMAQQIVAQQKEMLVFGGLFVLLGIMATLFITRAIRRPLTKMQTVLQQENMLGDFKGIHLPEQGGREVAGLAREVNRLGEKISSKMQRLESAQQIAKGYFDENPVATLITDLFWNIQAANARAMALFGITADRMPNLNLEDFLTPGDFLQVKQKIRKLQSNVEDFHCTVASVSGENIEIELSAKRLRDEDDIVQNYLITLYDVTRRMQFQNSLTLQNETLSAQNKKLARAVKRFKAIQEKQHGDYQKYEHLFRAADKMLCFTSRSNILELLAFDGCHLLQAEECVIYLRNHYREELLPVASYSKDYFRHLPRVQKSNTIIWQAYQSNTPQVSNKFSDAEFGAFHIANPQAMSALAMPLSLGEKKIGTVIFFRSEADHFSEADARFSSLLIHAAAIALEKYELVKMAAAAPTQGSGDNKDLQKSLQQAFQAQKMESLEILVGGIAHDFNNIFGIIIPNVDLLRMHFGEDPEIHKRLIAIQEASNRAANLTRQLVIFTRSDQIETTPIAPNQLVERLVSMLQRAFGDNIQLLTDLDPYIPNIEVDEAKLMQALVNLAVNARDAMPNGGKLAIRTSLEKFKPANEPNAKRQKYVRISLSDTGIGIPEKYLYNIFDPFFSTKSPTRGAGMGLAVVYGIIKSHYGYIAVETAEHKGTTFHIYLKPILIKVISDGVQHPAHPAQAQKERENILVVDDERLIRESLSDLLKHLGYNVFEATGGRHALQILKDRGDIHAAIVDYAMPRMNGIETIKAIREIDSKIKIVLSSGYADQEKVANAQEDIHAFLPKPVQLENLSGTFDQIFSERRAIHNISE